MDLFNHNIMRNDKSLFSASKATPKDIKQMILERRRTKSEKDRHSRMNNLLFSKTLSSNTPSEDLDIEMDLGDQDEMYANDITTENFDSLNLDNELDNLNDKYISVCPVCYAPAVSFKEFVSCVNLCFEFKISQELFNPNYSLDNLMDDYKSILALHSKCKSKVQVLLFQDRATFICEKCFSAEITTDIGDMEYA